jgi:GNAT superfamily N-acetyltransferase
VTLAIRLATEADWPAIWPFFERIVRAADTYCYAPDLPADAARSDWFDGCEVWVVESGAEVLGTYHLSPNKGGPGAHVANGSYMVSEASRGLGVGRAMVEHSIARAAEIGYRAIQFNAVVDTNIHAIRLYTELGFTTIGRVPEGFDHPSAGLVDLLIMYRKL